MDITTARTEPNEIAKNEDFEHAFQGIIKNSAIIDRMIVSADCDYVSGGMIKVIPNTMTFTVDPIWANGRDLELPAYQDEASEPIEVSIPKLLPRYDTVQVRGILQSFDNQRRAFFESELGISQYKDIDTKSKLVIEIKVNEGEEGTANAPETTHGYVKIAEIHVEPGNYTLIEDNIKGITARFPGDINTDWTYEKTKTFIPANLPEVMKQIVDCNNSKQDKLIAIGSANLLTAPSEAGGQPGKKALNEFLQSPAPQAANTQLLVAPSTKGNAPSLKPIDDFAPAKASLAAENGNENDITTPAISSRLLGDILQVLWKKIRSIANNIATLFEHTNTKTNPHQVTKAQVGLGNTPNEDWKAASLTVIADSATNITADTAEKTGSLIVHFNWLRQKINGILGSSGLGSKAPTSHASSNTTYGVGNDTNYGHVKLNNSTPPAKNGTAAVGSSGKAADAGHVHPVDDSRAPTSHASSNTTYGVGSDTNYGHVKLNNSTPPAKNGVVAIGSSGKAADAGHVHPVDDSRAPTSHASSNTTYGVGNDTNYGHVKLNTSTPPAKNGTAAVGSSGKAADAGHIHPVDDSRASLASPALTGTPTAPTAAAGTNTDQIATAKFVADLVFPVGSSLVIFPGDLTPLERKLPGAWEIWNTRVEIYGLSSTNPSSYSTYTAGTSVTVNAYRRYVTPEGDTVIIRAKEAIASLPTTIDPVKWYWPGETGYGLTITRVRRRNIQASWTAADLAIGYRVSTADNSPYNGLYVVERLVMAGKFLSITGGNRPTFVSGGVGRDQIRNITAAIKNSSTTYGQISGQSNGLTPNGAFTMEFLGKGQGAFGNANGTFNIGFDASLVVPTGPENSPRTLSTQFWRRVS